MKRAFALGTFTALVLVFLAGGTLQILPKPDAPAAPATAAAPQLPSVIVRVYPTRSSDYELLAPKRGPQKPVTYDAVLSLGRDPLAKLPSPDSMLVRVEPGSSASRKARIANYDVTFEAAIDRGVTRAATEVTLSRNGVQVLHQESDVMLRPATPQGVVPAQ